jgi:hypothetical protein
VGYAVSQRSMQSENRSAGAIANTMLRSLDCVGAQFMLTMAARRLREVQQQRLSDNLQTIPRYRGCFWIKPR